MSVEDFPTESDRPETPADAAATQPDRSAIEADGSAHLAPSTFRPAEFRPAVFTPGLPSSEPVREESHAAPAARQVGTRDEDTGLPTAWSPPVPALATAAADHAAPASAVTAAARSGPSTLNRISEELVAWFKTLFSAAVYATLIVTFGFQVARVEGLSMAPTLEDQDRLIVNKFAYRINDPQIGDIVMLYYPIDPDKSFVKRVVGEPGDTLRSVQGRVYRNDVPLPDDFIPEEYRDHDTWGPENVPPGQYFVMGDHRNNSSDSRTWKFVPKKYIIGKVQLRWWPLNHARLF